MVSRASITTAAVALEREHGSSGVSMSAVAGALGVKVASLYNHVRNLDELLVLLARELLEEIAVPDERLEWDSWLSDASWEVRRAFVEHDVLLRVPLLPGGPAVPPAFVETGLRVLVRAGFSLGYAHIVFGQQLFLVADAVRQEVTRRDAARHGVNDVTVLRAAVDGVGRDAAPLLWELADRLAYLPDEIPDYSDELFDWLLAIRIAGLRAMLEGEVEVHLLPQRPPVV